MTIKKLSELTDEELELAYEAAIETKRRRQLDLLAHNKRVDMAAFIRNINGVSEIDTDTHLPPAKTTV